MCVLLSEFFLSVNQLCKYDMHKFNCIKTLFSELVRWKYITAHVFLYIGRHVLNIGFKNLCGKLSFCSDLNDCGSLYDFAPFLIFYLKKNSKIYTLTYNCIIILNIYNFINYFSYNQHSYKATYHFERKRIQNWMIHSFIK